MKYIDADQIRTEIERLYNGEAPKHDQQCEFEDGYFTGIATISNLIDSLQQEHPDFPTTDEQVKEFLATHPKIKVPEKYKNPDWLFKKQEQPEVDLEKASRNVYESWMGGTMDDVRRDMVELGKALNARKEKKK